MPLPETERVQYAVNPLEEVTCKVQFPAILRVDVEPPMDFQERVRETFPLLQAESSITLPVGLPPAIAAAFQRDVSMGKRAHVFRTADKHWALRLSRDSLTLTAQRYGRWEEFREMLFGPLGALLQVYRPAFYSHVCLRYRNVIRRSRLNLENVSWDRLIQPWTGGILSHNMLSEAVESTQTRCLLGVSDDSMKVDATYGLGIEEASKESVFLIESHVFHDAQSEPANVVPRLDALNRQARFFFRWCITDQLHRALGPRPVD